MDLKNSFRTPCYVYDGKKIEKNFAELSEAMKESFGKNFIICYAVKANHNPEVLKLIKRLGGGLDCVSWGEIEFGLAAGFLPTRIILSGVGKTENEIRQALAAGIKQINVESEEELDEILDIVNDTENQKKVIRFQRCDSQQLKALRLEIWGVPVGIALRVNTNTDAKTHQHLTTGRYGDKFGIPLPTVKRILLQNWQTKYEGSLDFAGLTVHFGSQITSLRVFEEGFAELRELVNQIKAAQPKLQLADPIVH